MSILYSWLTPERTTSAAMSLARVYQDGRPGERRAVLFGTLTTLVGIGLGAAIISKLASDLLFPIVAVLGVAGLGLMGFGVASHEARIEGQAARAVDALEARVRDEPSKPKLAWELASLKLESYLDRNLRQVSSIFYLVVLVMLFGMGLIGWGVWLAMNTPAIIAPGALAALAGVVVQVIAGTLLVIYRSTMTQAKDFVVVLERINAVGMSINILEGVEGGDSNVKNEARVALAQNLLGLYAPGARPPLADQKRSSAA